MWIVVFRALVRLIGSRGAAAVRVSRAGRVTISGLIRQRPLAELTQQQVRNALSKAGIREAHNGHFVQKLIQRGPGFRIHTLDDFIRAFNSGTAAAGRDGTTVVTLAGSGARVVVNRFGHLVTLTGR